MFAKLRSEIKNSFPMVVRRPQTGRYSFSPVPTLYDLKREDSTADIWRALKASDIDDWYAASPEDILYFSQFIMQVVLDIGEPTLSAGIVFAFIGGLTIEGMSIDLHAFSNEQLGVVLRFLKEIPKIDPDEENFDHAVLNKVTLEDLMRKGSS